MPAVITPPFGPLESNRERTPLHPSRLSLGVEMPEDRVDVLSSDRHRRSQSPSVENDGAPPASTASG